MLLRCLEQGRTHHKKATDKKNLVSSIWQNKSRKKALISLCKCIRKLSCRKEEEIFKQIDNFIIRKYTYEPSYSYLRQRLRDTQLAGAVESIPAYGTQFETRWSVRPLPTQTILWFYGKGKIFTITSSKERFALPLQALKSFQLLSLLWFYSF